MKGCLKHILILALSVWALEVFAQDLHFSQFNENPQYINPALIGKFNGHYKFNLSYRNQWNSVTVPYRSLGAAFESSNFLGNKYFSVGASVFSNRAGDSEFTVNQMHLSVSYSIQINRYSALSFGISGGLNTFGLDLSRLQFDSQYKNDIGFSAQLPSGENLDRSQFIIPDANAGINYHLKKENSFFNIGFAAFHLIPSQVKFYTNTVNPSDFRFNLNYHYNTYLNDKNSVSVQGINSWHQNLSEHVFMVHLDHHMQNSNNIFRAGMAYRHQDAVTLILGVRTGALYFGYSFDYNTSSLIQSSRGIGASELSISYIYNPIESYKRRFDSCPVFL